MSTINLQHLKLLAAFVFVVEHGSFAAAAKALHTSRSRVSEQIAQLEADLGIRLLQRSTRKLSLTEEGKQVYERVRGLPRMLEETQEIASQEIPAGRVSITATHDVGVSQLLPALNSFRRQYPNIELNVILSDDRLDLVAEGIDLGVRIGVPRDDSLIGRILFKDRFQLFASPVYLASRGMPEKVSDLVEHRWLSLSKISPGGVHQLYRDGELITVRAKTYDICNSPQMTIAMVLAGMGLAQLFPSTVRKEIASGQLIPVLPELKSEELVFSLVYPSRKHVPLRTRALIDHLLSYKLFT